jgi:hypothetical protein
MLESYRDILGKYENYKAERNKVLADLDKGEVQLLKTTSENLNEMKKLLGFK